MVEESRCDVGQYSEDREIVTVGDELTNHLNTASHKVGGAGGGGYEVKRL